MLRFRLAAVHCVLALLPGALLPGAALAQPAPFASSQPGRQKAYAAMGRACGSEVARFCPEISPVQLRNIAICLRPYRNNLSLGCRSALRATKPGATAPAQGDPAG